tara:strand:- start:2058 stop:2261 length:204 start_codon:yes stop_codon:yes gene_type:complete
MPYVNIKITKEGGPSGNGPSADEKAELIKGVTELLERVLNKKPATTFVVGYRRSCFGGLGHRRPACY